MKSLFVEWSLAMVLAIVVSFLGLKAIVVNSIDRHRTKVIPPFGELVADELWARTDGVPAEQLPAVIDEYQRKLGEDVELLAQSRTDFPEHVTPRIEAGLIGWAGDHNGITVFVPLHDDEHVAALGPFEGLFDPHPADVAKAIAMMLAVVAVLTTLPLIPTVRRLRRLERAAQALGGGELDARVPEGPPNAIGQLERHFNAMAVRVEELMAGQRQLVQAVAHEIRTPIARIQFGLEMVELAEDDAEKTRRQAELQAELEELDALVGELLMFSRHDAGTAELKTEPIDVGDAIGTQVRRSAERYPEIAVELDGLDTAPSLEAHVRSFDRVVHNLVANALRHARTRVVVRTWNDEGSLVLEVEDDGPGIPRADRTRVFEPFARVDGSRDRSTGGIGLGLAIVHRIMTAHGGTVGVEAGGLGGARFVARW